MKSPKVMDFSNIYSPKNKQIMAKISKTMALTPLSPRSLTPRSKPSFLSPKHMLKIACIPEVEEVKKMTKLKLGKDKISQITYTLDVDQKSRKEFELRMKREDYYLAYGRNPLAELGQNNQEDQRQNLMGRNTKNKKKDLVAAISAMRDKDYFEGLKNRVDHVERNADEYLKKMKLFEEKERYLKTKPKRQDEDEVFITARKEAEKVVRSAFDELDDIVSMRDQDYFEKKREREPFNLFELKFNPDSSMFKSGKEQLQDVHFSLDSMSNSAPSILNETLMRGLSSFARTSVIKNTSKSIPADFKINEQNFPDMDLDQIVLSDILLVASGQVPSDIMLRFFNQDFQAAKRKKSDGSLEIEEQKDMIRPIVYRINHQNRESNFHLENFDKTEFVYLQEQKLTKREEQQKELSMTYLKKMRDTLNKQLKCLNNVIKDKQIHQQLNKEKQKIVIGMMDEDIDINNKNQHGDIERKIRINKTFKNQTEKIKIEQVVKTCQEKKIKESLMVERGKLKSQSKSKSRSKSKINEKKKLRTTFR